MAGVTMPSDVTHGAGGLVPAEATPDPPAEPKFDLDDIRTHGFIAKLTERLLEDPRWLMTPLRRFFPIVKIPIANTVAVTRYDDVQEVLHQDGVFDVPWKQYVLDLGGAPFLLSMDAGKQHLETQRRIMALFRRDDIASIVAPLSSRIAAEIIEKAGGRLEAIQHLISRVPTRICEEYFGVRVVDNPANADRSEEQRRDFAHWLIAMSTFTFGNPSDDKRYRRAAMAARDRIHNLVGRSIAEARRSGGAGNTVLDRMIKTTGEDKLNDIIIGQWLVGMMTGFVPTCTLASGRALETMMRNPDFLDQCQEAAWLNDDDLLLQCIRETMRFMPIFLGHQRICRRSYVVAQGTPRAREIAVGDHVLASTWSAMFDPTRIVDPNTFYPGRPPSSYMLFGLGLHSCVGIAIAEAQILQTLKALLVRQRLRRMPGAKGRMKWLGQFPGRLWVEFGAKPDPA
jgi:cytochrome P450